MKGDSILKVGIDIGSRAIKVVAAFEDKKTGKIHIAGATRELSEGIINGQVMSHKDALICVKKAIKKTEKALGVEIRRASLGISPNTIKYVQVKTKNTVARSSNEVGVLDLEKSKQEAITSIQRNSPLEILHTHLSYVYLDGKRVKGDVVGMIGHSIETVYTVSTIPKKTLENFISLFDDLQIEIVEICDNAFMSSIPLTKSRDRGFGVAILDIGSDNTSLTIYENDLPVQTTRFNLGGNTFTKDISICLGLPMNESEDMKKSFKNQEHRYDSSKDSRKLGQIIDARIDDLAFLIQKELKKIESKTQIPNGLILSGGGAHLYNLKEKLKARLSLPVHDGREILKESTEGVLNDSVWTNAYALTFITYDDTSTIKRIAHTTFNALKKIFTKIAP